MADKIAQNELNKDIAKVVFYFTLIKYYTITITYFTSEINEEAFKQKNSSFHK